jgi:Pentapeptide repeats (8 copies)
VADFIDADLRGSRFEHVDLSGAQLRDVDLTGARFGPGWPPPRSYPVRECLLIILNEEWEHRLYAERDLGVLEAGRP